MKKKCKVVMLTTDKKSRLYKAPWDEPPFIGYFNNPQETIKGDTIAQHLYLISDDEIKEGDWCIDSTTNDLFQVDSIDYNIEVHENAMDFRSPKVKVNLLISDKLEIACRHDKCKKVIASTDKLLKSCTCGGRVNDEGKFYHKMGCHNKEYLPTFSKDFIKAYAKANGEIDEVNVEYYVAKCNHPSPHGGCEPNCKGIHGKLQGVDENCSYPTYQLKLRDDSTVIISEAKTMYSRDEVAELIRKFRRDNSTSHEKLKQFLMKQCEEWIEENL